MQRQNLVARGGDDGEGRDDARPPRARPPPPDADAAHRGRGRGRGRADGRAAREEERDDPAVEGPPGHGQAQTARDAAREGGEALRSPRARPLRARERVARCLVDVLRARGDAAPRPQGRGAAPQAGRRRRRVVP
eukprot:30723-Pelagococcus_subviridis.AAC.8